MKHFLFKINPWAQAKFWQKLLREERERSAKLEGEAYMWREELDHYKSVNGIRGVYHGVGPKPNDILNTKSYS